jgi:putative tricarboxylic transport membrane protein
MQKWMTGWVCAVAALAASGAAAEPRAPEGNVEITVGTSPGGTPDVIMRQMARVLAESGLVQNPMVVVNRTGGSWTVSSNYVLGREGDDNLLYAIAQPMITTPIVQGFDNTWDKLTPIAMFVRGDLIVFTHADAPYQTLGDVLEKAKAEPMSVSLAGAQAGSTDHLTTALLEQASGAAINYVPFDGGGAALAAFLGRNTDLVILPPVEALDLMAEGTIRPLAILSEERRTEPELADIPTAREQGYEALWGQAWGVAGPPGMSAEVADWWGEKIAAMVETPEWEALMAESYFVTDFVGRDGAAEALQAIYEDHLAVLRQVGLSQQ